MKIKIISTGISGLVGSRIVELLSHKYEFINFSLDTGIDITDFKLLKQKLSAIPEAKVVLHLAAFTDVSMAWEQNGDKNGSCYKVNVLGSKNIAQLCRQYNKYLINISTDFVFDGKNTSSSGYTEKNIPSPIEWYGQTKLWAEKEIEQSDCKYVILRIAFPYKAKTSTKTLEPNPKLDLIRKIVAYLRHGRDLNMFTDQMITPTFIDDIAKAIDKIIEVRPQGIFHSVGSTSLSPYDLAIKVAKVFKLDESLIKKASLVDYLRKNPSARPRQKNLTLANKKIKAELGIKMSTIDEGLQECLKQISNS